MTSVSRDALVTADFRVRRRKYGDLAMLICQTRYLPLDPISDSVWLECERECTVAQIIESVARRHGLALGDATGATAATLGRLRALGYVRFEEVQP